MSERLGTCLGCGQRFDQIPASFTGNQISCPKCQGTVEIKATDAPVSEEPTKASVKATSLSPKAPQFQRPRRGMPVDRSVVRPKPNSQTQVPSAPPKPDPEPEVPAASPQPESKPAPLATPAEPKPTPADSPAPPEAEPKPKVVTPAGPTSEEKKQRAQEIIAKARAKREQAAAQAKDFTSEAPKKPTGPELIAQLKQKKGEGDAPKIAAGSRRPSPSSRSSKRKSKVAGRRPKREPRENPEAKSRLGTWIGVGLFVALGGWSVWYLTQAEDESSASVEANAGSTTNSGNDAATSEPEVLALPPAAPLLAVADEATIKGQAPEVEESNPPNKVLETSKDNSSQPEGINPKPAPKAAPSVAFVVPQPGEPIATRGISDFFALDLTKVPPLSRWSETSDETWQDVQSKLALFLDDQGVRSTRAADKLLKISRDAYPAIVNQMMTLDYSTKEGHYVGAILNDLIVKIGAGKNYGWKGIAEFEEGSGEFLKLALVNKKVAAYWQNRWVKQLAHDDAQWNGFITSTKARLAKEKAESGNPTTTPAPTPEDGLFDD